MAREDGMECYEGRDREIREGGLWRQGGRAWEGWGMRAREDWRYG